MNGEINIILENSHVHFELKFDRNISFIRGDSGTGKTFICNLITDSYIEDSGVKMTIDRDIKVIVMPENTLGTPLSQPWTEIIKNSHNTLFFIDDGCDCLKGKPISLSEASKHTDNYYVICSRKSFSDLPYNEQSIYELKISPDAIAQPILRNIRIFDNGEG